MPNESPDMLRSFGRKRGRRLTDRKQALVDDLLPRITLVEPLEETAPIGGLAEFLSSQPNTHLEIGFGAGEHLAGIAAADPESGFIGCEPYINGVANFLTELERLELSNIRIFRQDARRLLQKLPEASIHDIYILYPDPWPKLRHQKRRLVNRTTLDLLAKVQKPGATLMMASDDADYVAWMLEHALAHPSWRWLATQDSDWRVPPQGWVTTKYEQKALRAGRVPSYLLFERV